MSKFITGEQFNEGVKQVASYLNDKINDVANAPKKDAHNHNNKEVLDKISINESGRLLYNGATVGLKGDKGNTGAAGADGKNIELKAGEDDNCVYWRHEGSEGDMGWELLFDMTELLGSVHKHSNKEVIDLISKDETGNLLFNGNLISGAWEDIKNKPDLIEKVELIENELVFTFTNATEQKVAMHFHDNKDTIDKISETENGNLLFGNKEIDGHKHINIEILEKMSEDESGQLLFNDKLVDGHKHENLTSLDKISEDEEGNFLFDNKKISGDVSKEDLIDFMKKEDFVSQKNPKNVKSADVALSIKGIEDAQPFMYYGKDKNGEIGFHYMSIDNGDNNYDICEIEQRVILNAINGKSYHIDSINDMSEGKAFIQVYKFAQGEQDIIKTVKTFNNKEKENFYYDENNILFDEDGCTIKNEFEVDVALNDTLYETTFINKKEFLEIKLI